MSKSHESSLDIPLNLQKKTLKTSVAVAFKSTGSVCRQFAGKTFFLCRRESLSIPAKKGEKEKLFWRKKWVELSWVEDTPQLSAQYMWEKEEEEDVTHYPFPPSLEQLVASGMGGKEGGGRSPNLLCLQSW